MSDQNGSASGEVRADDAVVKLQQYFRTIAADAPDQQIRGWEGAWQQALTPWDRGRPNPALVDALAERPELSSTVAAANASHGGSPPRRKRALVPGCGRGVDVLLLAAHGFEAWGVDASASAVAAARALQQQQQQQQQASDSSPAEQGQGGEAHFLEADFFHDDIEALTHSTPARTAGESRPPARGFDLIYDYTFLCALPPELRPRWAARMAALLAPRGVLLCLEYPLHKAPALGGPPYGLSAELYVQLFWRPGEEVRYDGEGYVVVDEGVERAEGALVRVDRWRPERTFAEPGAEVRERMSLWERWRK